MAKPRRDSKREDRIRNEVIVDTYNAEEQVNTERRIRCNFKVTTLVLITT
jgi:hypothetical protein